MARKNAGEPTQPTWTRPTYAGHDWSISSAIRAYGGDKKEFVAAYAEESGKTIPTAKRAINRWLLGEQEKATGVKTGKEARQLNRSRQSQGEINRIVNKSSGVPAEIKLSGKIGVNGLKKGDYMRVRTIKWSVSWDDIYALEDTAKNEGEEAAWEQFADLYEVKSVYMESGTISVY